MLRARITSGSTAARLSSRCATARSVLDVETLYFHADVVYRFTGSSSGTTATRLGVPLTRAMSSSSTPPFEPMSSDKLDAFGAHHITKGLGRIKGGIMAKGEGSYVVYEDGQRMLDFTSGIGVTNLGERRQLLRV